MAIRCDVVVVGGGHNGLVCAAYLARSGLDVVVLERNDELGGALFSSSTRRGNRLEHAAIEHTGMFGSGVVEELDLARWGLRYAERSVAGMQMFGDGTRIAIGETAEETADSIAEVDGRDAQAWLELARLCPPMLAALSAATGVWNPSFTTVSRLARIALGRAGRDLVQLASSSVLDLGLRWFRSPHMRALAVSRAWFAGLPPWYQGTGAVFCMTPGGHGRRFARPIGGSRAVVAALVAALDAAGGEVRRGDAVTRISTAGRGWEVRTEGGATIRPRRAVVAAISPRTTLLDLVQPTTVVPAQARRHLADAEVVPGNVTQLTLAAELQSPPSFAALPHPDYGGSMLAMFRTPDAVFDPYVAAAFGELPGRPGVWVSFPSVMDPSAAPAGGATMWANAFITHRLGGERSWSQAGDELRERLWETIEACLPGVRAAVVGEVLTTPEDLARRTGAENAGSHLAPTLRQSLGGRPAPGLAGHRALPGLYLSGAGTNPGGGVSGLPGRDAARRLLADLAGGFLGSRRVFALARQGRAQLGDAARALSAARASLPRRLASGRPHTASSMPTSQ